MSQTLREMMAESNSIVDILAETGGVLPPELEAQLSNIETKIPAKIDSYSLVIKRLESEATFWKDEAKKLTSIAKGCENAAERIRGNLKRVMIENGLNEVFGTRVRFLISKAKPKLIVDEQALTKEYILERVVFEPDTDKILADLEAGKTVPGAKFEEVKTIRSYVNASGER